jgi:hypothetical protein
MYPSGKTTSYTCLPLLVTSGPISSVDLTLNFARLLIHASDQKSKDCSIFLDGTQDVGLAAGSWGYM